MLCLRQNFVEAIEGLEDLTELTELELRDNALERIEGLDALKQLTSVGRPSRARRCWPAPLSSCPLVSIGRRTLDISYNGIRKIANLEALEKLTKLFLANNKIKVIRNLEHMTRLTMLELGANRIRVGSGPAPAPLCCLSSYSSSCCLSPRPPPPAPRLRAQTIENLSPLSTLTELFLGKNKITAIDGLSSLVELRVLSLQVGLRPAPRARRLCLSFFFYSFPRSSFACRCITHPWSPFCRATASPA